MKSNLRKCCTGNLRDWPYFAFFFAIGNASRSKRSEVPRFGMGDTTKLYHLGVQVFAGVLILSVESNQETDAGS